MGKGKVFALIVSLLLIINGTNSVWAKAEKGMTQGELAMLLVEMVEAEGLLPEAAVANDAIKLLESVDIAPSKGWKATEPATPELLAELLGLKEAAGISFKELLDMLKERLTQLLWARTGLRPSISPVAP